MTEIDPDIAPGIASTARYGDAPFFIFCDHASNVIPPALNGLGIPDDVLKTHIAWDIGAGALATALGAALGATVFKCGFSRLVIDPNRAVNAADLIPATSDQIPVPGNQMMSATDRTARIETYHTPYHHALGRAIRAMQNAHGRFLAVSIHSFTNRLMGDGDERPWPIGLLWHEDEPSARMMMEYLRRETGWPIGDNEPYDARVFNYSVDEHIGPKDIPHLTLELRQDKICDTSGVEEMAALIAGGVKAITTNDIYSSTDKKGAA